MLSGYPLRRRTSSKVFWCFMAIVLVEHLSSMRFRSLRMKFIFSQNHQENPRPLNTEWLYMKIPYISERLNYRITSIFRKEDIPVRVAHKSYTLRRALSHNNKERTCTRANCPISGTKLCLVRNAVYQITCSNCNQHYIGSTIRFIHDRVREHLNNDNSSVKKHLSQCQSKVY